MFSQFRIGIFFYHVEMCCRVFIFPPGYQKNVLLKYANLSVLGGHSDVTIQFSHSVNSDNSSLFVFVLHRLPIYC